MSCQFIENAGRHYINRQPLFGPTNREAYTQNADGLFCAAKSSKTENSEKQDPPRTDGFTLFSPLQTLPHCDPTLLLATGQCHSLL